MKNVMIISCVASIGLTACDVPRTTTAVSTAE